MKFIDEYRDASLIGKIAQNIQTSTRSDYTFMEVCGGHTMAIHRFGLRDLLPGNIHLLSGPGCPVCVTARNFIDKAVAIAQMENTILATFGDLIRVPGSHSTLERERSKGRQIKTVFSPLDAVEMAHQNPDKTIVFLGIGFETTAPGTAIAIKMANRKNLGNFMALSAHKLMKPAMQALIHKGIKIDGYLCPGHVSTITGSAMYSDFPEKYGVACVISGFEPVDMLQSIKMMVDQLEKKQPAVEIQYSRAVKPNGNEKALEALDEVFEPTDTEWRGFGVLPKSGLKIRQAYSIHDAENRLSIPEIKSLEDKACICGEILKGLKTPIDCNLFGTACTPENPVGACMVSSEGACAALYKYQK
ncbi:MAG: hydrogenase formation protein HypD [Bacteroidales bacterium]|nr:hydrogenase formation protein HypD [Bacteroidales bacterium]